MRLFNFIIKIARMIYYLFLQIFIFVMRDWMQYLFAVNTPFLLEFVVPKKNCKFNISNWKILYTLILSFREI